MHSITTLTEFQQVAQRDYCKALVMTHVNVVNEIFHVLEVANEAHILTHTTKRRFKHNGLIIKNLVGRGNRTPDHCYNDSMTITPLAQTGCTG